MPLSRVGEAQGCLAFGNSRYGCIKCTLCVCRPKRLVLHSRRVPECALPHGVEQRNRPTSQVCIPRCAQPKRGPRTAGPRGKAGHDARQKVRVAAGVPPNVHLHPAPGCKSVTESSPDKPAKLRRMRGRSQSSFIKAAKAAGYTSIKMLPDGTLVADLPHESAAVSNGAAPTDDVEQWFEQHANQS